MYCAVQRLCYKSTNGYWQFRLLALAPTRRAAWTQAAARIARENRCDVGEIFVRTCLRGTVRVVRYGAALLLDGIGPEGIGAFTQRAVEMAS